jgi:hypothetical protein
MVVKVAVEGLRLLLRRGRSCISNRDRYIGEVGAFLTYLSNFSTILSS